jgi:hypothetical protein
MTGRFTTQAGGSGGPWSSSERTRSMALVACSAMVVLRNASGSTKPAASITAISTAASVRRWPSRPSSRA